MNKTVTSLAILKVNWDHERKDYIESFVPFLVALIKKKKYRSVNDIGQIRRDFAEEWGLEIPHHPMMTILTRLKKHGYIRKVEHQFLPVERKMAECNLAPKAKEQLANVNKVIDSFQRFCKTRFDVDLSTDEAEQALILFLKMHDLDILFAAHDLSTTLPRVKPNKRHRFLFNNFVTDVYKSQPEMFGIIVDVATGHMLASVLLVSDLPKYETKLRRLEVFLDTNLIFRLLGVDGHERGFVYREFLKVLRDDGATLRIFRHTYDEVKMILENCLNRIGRSDYDPVKANPALKHFVDCDYTESDVERFIVNVDYILKDNKIENIEIDFSKEVHPYQIDEAKLSEMIVDIYTRNDPAFDQLVKEKTIRKDVDSIAAIYRMRRGRTADTLTQARCVFVTTNAALAYASRRYDLEEDRPEFRIPTCLTDTFVGTMIWLQHPLRIAKINEKKMIADCYAALQPTPAMLEMYLKEVERLKNDGRVNTDEYYLLRQSRVTRQLLEEKALGDPDQITGKTIQEYLDDIRKQTIGPVQEKYLIEKERYEKTHNELQDTQTKLNTYESNIKRFAEKAASALRGLFFVGAAFALTLAVILQVWPGLLSSSLVVNKFLTAVFLLLSLANVLFGINVKGITVKMQSWLMGKIESYFQSI
ncbi:MAG: hypothetical protein ABII79_08940 [bacterium]